MSILNLSALDRRSLIELTLDTTTATTQTPGHMVRLADLPIWVELLDVTKVFLRLRADGRVDVMAGASYGGQYTSVHTVADLVRDMELPPDVHGEWTWWPVAELWRLESLSAVERAS